MNMRNRWLEGGLRKTKKTGAAADKRGYTRIGRWISFVWARADSRLYCVSAAVVFLAAGATLARAADQPRQIFAREYYHTFAHNNPVLERIKPGEIIFTRTLDSGGQDEKNEHRSQPSNPLTGPFYVEGAEKGDAIAVHFRKVRL